jgi:hypothetical protein
MSTKKSPKQILDDIGKELDITGGISDVFNVLNHNWEMALLNEEESNWRMAHVVVSTKLSAVASFRLPTLAIGIRKIDGISIADFFEDDWQVLSEAARQEMLLSNPFTRKYFCAEHLMNFLSQRFPEGVAELWEKWQELEDRRKEAISSLKKSSGESSAEEKSQSTTEPSPIGASQ